MGLFSRNYESEAKQEKPTYIEKAGDQLAPQTTISVLDNPTYAGLAGNKLVFAITTVCCIGFSLFGYDQGVMSGIITAPQFFTTFPQLDPVNTGPEFSSLLQSTYVALYEIGCLMGAVVALLRGGHLGRRRMIMLGSGTMIIGVIIQIAATGNTDVASAIWLWGRILTGVGNGMNTSTLALYLSECSPSHNRGLLVSIEASMIAVGTAVAYWVDLGLSFVNDSASWRVPIGLQIILAVGVLVGAFYMPESPRWLAQKGYYQESRRVIAALNNDSLDGSKTNIQVDMIVSGIAASHALGEVKKRNMFTNGKTQHFRRMLLGASTQFFQQIGGANAVIYFSTQIFEQNLGLSRQLALILGGTSATVYSLGTVISFFTIETVGRRKMYLAGSIGQAASMLIIFACLKVGGPEVSKGGVFGVFLFLFTFGATWLQLPWLTPAEINPTRTRTPANAVSTMTNWLFNFAVVEITPPLLVAIDAYTFLLFAIINICFIPIIYFTYPETAGRSLEEIDVIFAVAYLEKRSYVEVSLAMPKLSEVEVKSEAIRLGLTEDDGQSGTSSQTEVDA